MNTIKSLSKYCKVVVIKTGAEGSLVGESGRIIKIPGYKVKAIDTTGAGDMYAGAFLYGFTHGCSLEQCGRLANYAASRICEVMGARLTTSIKDKIRTIL